MLVTCAEGYRLGYEACVAPGVCAEADDANLGAKGAVCALGTSADARCPVTDDEVNACDGKTLLTCEKGFLIEDLGCEVDCLETDGQAFCVLSTTPDERCSDGSYCDGDVAVRCCLGYVTSRHDCSADEFYRHCLPELGICTQ